MTSKTPDVRAALNNIYATHTPKVEYLMRYESYFNHLIKIGERCFNKNICCELLCVTTLQLSVALGSFNYYALLTFFSTEIQQMFSVFGQSQILYYFNLLT